MKDSRNIFGIKNLEFIILLLVFYILSLGVLVSYINVDLFEAHFVHEDKTVEWLSVLMLLLSCSVFLKRAFLSRKNKVKLFLLAQIFAGSVFFFGAGEEMSWGQRQLDFEVPTFFKENNSQREANIHNLVISGTKINKLIFGTFLGIAIALYLLVLPFFYDKSKFVKHFVDDLGIPLPRGVHLWSYIFIFIISSLIPTSKKGELLEFCGVAIFFLIILYPKNTEFIEAKLTKKN